MTAIAACSRPPETQSIGAAMMIIVAQPWTVFVVRWNWKAALLSAGIRGLLFCVVVVPHGSGAMRGAFIEIVFRIALGGCWGSMMQALRCARPAWLAGLLVALVLPASAHVLEYVFLRAGGAAHIAAGMVVSVLFSAASLVVNFALMRHGLMLTGQGAASLWSDLRRLPGTVGDFALWVRKEFMR